MTKRLRTFAELHALKQQIEHRLYTDMEQRKRTLDERAHQLAYQSLDDPAATNRYDADHDEAQVMDRTKNRLRAAYWAIDHLLANGWYDGPDYHGKPHPPAPNAPAWAYIDDAPPREQTVVSEGEQLLRFFGTSTHGEHDV